MPRGPATLVALLTLPIAGLALLPNPAEAETTTYHLHDEPSTTAGLGQLTTRGPDRPRVSVRSEDLKGQAAGSAVIRSFDTPAGVPGLGGFIPANSLVTVTLWMKTSTAFGTVLPQATVRLNTPATATLCTATGAAALTTTLQPVTLSCTTGAAPIAMSTTDRVAISAGYLMTVGPGRKKLRVVLRIEGRLNARTDSRVVVPNPVPPIGDLLAITSPAEGTVVSPGQSLAVTITSPAAATFDVVGLAGEGEIGMIDVGNILPGQVSLPIPPDMACRTYTLTAVGATVSGQDATATVLIDVERPDTPIAISTLLPQILFEVQGSFFPIGMLARFADESLLDVTESSNVHYVSADPTVATVDASGIVTAIAPGTTSVRATYGDPADNLAVEIPVTVPPPPFATVPAALDFGEQDVGTPASRSFTLTNNGTAPLRILSVGGTGDFTSADDCGSASPLDGGAACTITVTFSPTAVGLRTGTVLIENDFNSVPVGFRVSGTGVGQ